MKTNETVKCTHLGCTDIVSADCILPSCDIDPEAIKIVMITECPPESIEDYFYTSDNSFYMQTTLHAFKDAGFNVSTVKEIIDMGVYLTTAVKCTKTQYAISTETIESCSYILEKELSLFTNARVYMLMGDVAIKAFNFIAKRQTKKKAIPSGSTYKIRHQEFFYNDKRIFPSYVMTGYNYLIEKSKRYMVADDLKRAFASIIVKD